jgi:hypothetical protein
MQNQNLVKEIIVKYSILGNLIPVYKTVYKTVKKSVSLFYPEVKRPFTFNYLAFNCSLDSVKWSSHSYLRFR